MLHVRERDCLICSPWPGQRSVIFFVDGKVVAFCVVFAGHQGAVICANPEFAVLGLGALGACLTWWNYGFSATLYTVALVYGMRRVSLATQSTFCLPRFLDSKTLFFLPTISNPVAQISTIKMARDAMESNLCFSASHVQSNAGFQWASLGQAHCFMHRDGMVLATWILEHCHVFGHLWRGVLPFSLCRGCQGGNGAASGRRTTSCFHFIFIFARWKLRAFGTVGRRREKRSWKTQVVCE